MPLNGMKPTSLDPTGRDKQTQSSVYVSFEPNCMHSSSTCMCIERYISGLASSRSPGRGRIIALRVRYVALLVAIFGPSMGGSVVKSKEHRHPQRTKVSILYNLKYTGILKVLMILLGLPIVSAMPNPFQDTQQIPGYDTLSGVSMWDGTPHYDFEFVWFVTLGIALGQIIQDGNTLFETANGQDQGRNVQPIILTDESTPAQREAQANRTRHILRKTRLAACILKYISPNSYLHRVLTQNMMNDGVKMYEYIREVGKLAKPEFHMQLLRDKWDKATMSKVGIKYTNDGIFKWAEWVLHMAQPHKCNKSPRQCWKLFIDGFPPGFDAVVTNERMNQPDGTVVFPLVFPTYHWNPGAGDPNAGKPDILGLARKWYPEWSRRIASGTIKPIPQGNAMQVNEGNDDDSESSDVEDYQSNEEVYVAHKPGMARKVTCDDICGACGGRGHFTKTGNLTCPTATLETRPPHSELIQTKYPNGLKYPFPNPPKSETGRSDLATGKKPARPTTRNVTPRRSRPSQSKQRAKIVSVENSPPPDLPTMQDDDHECKYVDSDAEADEFGKSVTLYSVDDAMHIVTTPPI